MPSSRGTRLRRTNIHGASSDDERKRSGGPNSHENSGPSAPARSDSSGEERRPLRLSLR